MGIHNSAGVAAAAALGIRRVILERQVTLEELRRIAAVSPVELEVFVHGSLCCSLSGRCLLSSALGGWSGNRGKCKQPCRRCYEAGKRHGFLLSPKDLEGVELLPDNAEICRRNLFDIWCAAAGQYEPTEADAENVKAILRRNIACGDFLKKQHADGTPIWFLKED